MDVPLFLFKFENFHISFNEIVHSIILTSDGDFCKCKQNFLTFRHSLTLSMKNISLFFTYRFDEEWESMGCHESTQGATKLIRCTCETDLCNAESADWMQQKVTIIN